MAGALDGRKRHQIGSHTFSHQKLAGSGKDTILQEINKTEVLLSSVLGEGREYWLRPPYGLIDEAGKNWENAHGLLVCGSGGLEGAGRG